jgi:predicted nucleic-acid-binding protein
MSIAIDTNVLVRILVQDPTAPNQCAAARRLVTDATEAGEPLLVSLCALLETEWVLRSRYRVSRKAMVD